MHLNSRKKARQFDTLVIHAGTEKTGTTSLQQFLYENRRSFRAQGIGLLKRFGRPNNREFVAYFQKHLDDWTRSNGILTQSKKSEFFINFQSKFETELNASMGRVRNQSGRALVLTSEHFSSRLRSVDELRGLRAFLLRYFSSIRILFYFRPQEEMALSLYSTLLKGGRSIDLETLLASIDENDSYYDFLKLTQNWATVFGKENLVINLYDSKNLIHGDIRHDFLEVLESIGLAVDRHKLRFSQKLANQGLPRLKGAAIRALNEVVPYWNVSPKSGPNKRHLRLMQAINGIEVLDKGKFENPNPGNVQSKFDESNTKFFREFLPEAGFGPMDQNFREESLSFTEAEEVVYELTKNLLIQKMSGQHSLLLNSDADYLSLIGSKILKEERISRSDGIKILELAHRARPGETSIAKALKEARANGDQVGD